MRYEDSTYSPFERDEHYLRRIDRLDPAHAELALSLYRDDELVRALLKELPLPEDAERVAISLGDPERGPFVIITRDGHFVTCLGEGMSKGDLPLITREDLDRLSERQHALRKLLRDLESGGQRETQRLIQRVARSGDRLTREQFVAAERWAPLLSDQFLGLSFRLAPEIGRGQELLVATKKLTAGRLRPHLEVHWQGVWSLTHQGVLMACDDGVAVRRFLAYDDVDDELRQYVPLVLDFPASIGRAPLAVRAAWVVARMGDVLLDPLEELYTEPCEVPATLAHGVGLLAIGMARPQDHRRITGILGRSVDGDGSTAHAVDRAIRDEIGAQHALGLRASDDASKEQALARARADALRLKEADPSLCDRWGDPAELPDDVLPAWLASVPCDLFDGLEGLRCLCGWLPWVLELSPAELYLPERYMPATARDWEPAWTLELLEPRRKLRRALAVTQRTVSDKPGRNAPCTCGSGKKYKRCCGSAA